MARLDVVRKNWLAVGIGVGTVMLFALGLQQYWWARQLSESQASVLRTSLANAVRQFEREAERELALLLALMQPPNRGPRGIDYSRLAERRAIWAQASSYPGILQRTIVHYRDEEGQWAFYEMPVGSSEPEPVTAGASLAAVKAELAQVMAPPASSRDSRPPFWVVVPESHALVRSLLVPDRTRRPAGGPRLPRWSLDGFLILIIDWDYVLSSAVPALVDRSFSDADGKRLYDIAIAVDDGRHFLYRTDAAIDRAWFARTDMRRPLGDVGRGAGAQFRFGNPNSGLDPLRRRGDVRDADAGPFQPPRPGPRTPGANRLPVLKDGQITTRPVEVGAVHVAGSLSAAVSRQYRRDLATAFGVFVLLAGAAALVVVSARRAARLAGMQMDFIAGMTHELRTPLSVICSVGENLADGVVRTPEGAKRYGALVLKQARRLRDMVEDALQFASLESGGRRFSPTRVRLAPELARAVDRVRPIAEQAGFRLESSPDFALPDVSADKQALQQILANLLSNAVKYGEPGRWVGVDAVATSDSGTPEVRVHIRDRGPGIVKREQPRVFDAYYRGSAAKSGIPGSGLGLKLARDLAAGMGARLSLKSIPGRGSVFTLHLPALALDP